MLAKASQPEYTLTHKIEIIKENYAPIFKTRDDDYFM